MSVDSHRSVRASLVSRELSTVLKDSSSHSGGDPSPPAKADSGPFSGQETSGSATRVPGRHVPRVRPMAGALLLVMAALVADLLAVDALVGVDVTLMDRRELDPRCLSPLFRGIGHTEPPLRWSERLHVAFR